MINNSILIQQFLACASTFLDLPEDFLSYIKLKFSAELPKELEKWFEKFNVDLYSSRCGYPIDEVYRFPYTELQIEESLGKYIKINDYRKILKSSICLSHDIDHLSSSLKLSVKDLIRDRRILNFFKKKNYLGSIEKLLSLDNQATKVHASTVFVSCPIYSNNPLYWPLQWLVDPSYDCKHRLFIEFKEILDRFLPEVGIHGSFLSLSQGLLSREINFLSQSLNRKINISRQHWLNLPVKNSFAVLKKSGVEIDSTLGWNGNIGFRGGMARPFPIYINENNFILEIPLVVMDCALLLDMRFSCEEAINICKEIISVVVSRHGCVAINWHDRAFHPSVHWGDSYIKLLEWLVKIDINFKSMIEAITSYGLIENE